MPMTRINKLWAVAAMLLLLGTPGLSCFVPRQVFNADANDCCAEMGGQCGAKTMSSPHSCCEAPSQHAQPYVKCGNHSGPFFAAVVAEVAQPIGALLPSVLRAVPSFRELHSPPLAQPETNSILRI